MNRRKTSFWTSTSRAITPALPSGGSEVDKLYTENRKLRAQLSYEKRKHEILENALARQLSELTRTIATMQDAVRLLGAELVPRRSKQ